MSVCGVLNAEFGPVGCDFNEIDICGYRDQSIGEIGWTRYYDSGKCDQRFIIFTVF